LKKNTGELNHSQSFSTQYTWILLSLNKVFF